MGVCPMNGKRAKQLRRQARQKILKTIWRVPDDVWPEVQKLLPREKPAGTRGRPVVPFRQVFDGILYVLRTCQGSRHREHFLTFV